MHGPDPRWWLNLPPCPRCSKSHVLINCTKRLDFEVARDA